jgi:cytochrome c
VIRWLGAFALLVPGIAWAQTTNQIGERAFQRCYSCHSVVKGETGLSGPNLSALKNRRIASDPDFEYSKAFRKFASATPRWTPELLDRFLADPQKLVPGNDMGFFGLKKADERSAIVTYMMERR